MSRELVIRQDMESSAERQQNEVTLLKAIFLNDLKDLREKDAWKVYRAPELQITLFPTQETNKPEEVYVQIDLVVKCSSDYPESVPEIKLENAKGLSLSHIANLKEKLETEAKKLKGEVMMFELTQLVKNFLSDHNVPPLGSFYEEMLSNKKRQQEALEQETRIQREKEHHKIEAEIARRKKEFRLDAKIRRQQSDSNVDYQNVFPSPNIEDLSPIPDTLLSISPISRPLPELKPAYLLQRFTSTPFVSLQGVKSGCDLCGSNRPTRVSFKKLSREKSKADIGVEKGACLGHGTNGTTVYAGMDSSNGELKVITEWRINLKTDIKRNCNENQKEILNSLDKQLVKLEEEYLPSLLKLSHQNLIHYYALRHKYERENFFIQVLKEYINGHSLTIHLNGHPLPLDILIVYVCGILEAIVYLHQNMIVHSNIRVSSIFLDRNGIIRVGDYGLDKKLSYIYNSTKNKDKKQDILVQENKREDIYKLGILTLSLAKGEANDQEVKVPSNFPLSLKDFLDKCLSLNEEKRWTAQELLNHSFLKNDIENIPINYFKEVPQINALEVNVSITSSQDSHPTSFRQSRVQTEFEILQEIGKGSFGDVLKVQNRLDGGIYALKRIRLDPRSIQLNRKIFREVKLLSRLNHENVVRYFNSWIETGTYLSDDSSREIESEKNIVEIRKKILEDNLNEVEKNAGKAADKSIEWSISYDEDIQTVEVDDDSASEDETTVFGADFFPDEDSNDSIIFEDSRNSEFSVCEPTTNKNNDDDKSDETAIASTLTKTVQYMYIQMEYCDKSTLFTCIRDDSLFRDESRLWRLFRGIVEGLSHIHKQGMIHRDLKPVNIFLDSSDRVKIGDFGLATTQIIGRSLLGETNYSLLEKPPELSSSDLVLDETRTGKVGTYLYASPELENANSRKTYNQKVDIYSMGIILFEMCYPPLKTSMERVKILSNLRTEKIIFPPDYDIDSRQATIIRSLLNHDPSKRPTSSELLNFIPLGMEEAKQLAVIQTTVTNTQSKMHKNMIALLLSQNMSGIADTTYDIDLYKGCFTMKSLILQDYLLEVLTKIFLKHGAIRISSPLLMPTSSSLEGHKLSVRLMNNNGGIVSLPYDLQTPFARFLAKSNLSNFKRFSIERVFRERKIYGCHPREVLEATFDIVTTSPGGSIADAEVLAVFSEILKQFPALKPKDFFIRLNHTLLLKAIFNVCCVPEEKYPDAFKILNDNRLDRTSKDQVQSCLAFLSVPENKTLLFLKFLELQGPVGKVSTSLFSLIRKKKKVLAMAKKALYELETIIQNAEYLGVSCQIILSLNLAYGASHFSGMICQFVCENKKKKKKGAFDVLATGGRYDKLISNFKSFPTTNTISAVGIRIATDRILAILEQEEITKSSPVDVLVASILPHNLTKAKLLAVQNLWAAGVSADIIIESLQKKGDLEDVFIDKNVDCIVQAIDEERMIIKSLNKEKDKIVDKEVSLQELGESVRQILNSYNKNELNLGTPFPGKSNSCSNLNHSNSLGPSGNSVLSMINITFMLDEKLSLNSKRKYEQQIQSRLTPIIPQFSNKVIIEIIVVELTYQVLKTIASHLEMESENTFTQSITSVIDKHQRYRKYLNKVFDHIQELAFRHKQRNPIILYSHKDDLYKLLL